MKGFETIVKARITTRIKYMINEPSEDYLNMLILAYNRWQEDEHSAVDYIFNINNPDDLIVGSIWLSSHIPDPVTR